MRRHASLGELADLDAGILRPGKAAKISQHMAGCSECAQLSSQLSAIPDLLSSIQYPAMPEHLSARIAGALAYEGSARLAAEPSTEAGRLDVPARRSRDRRREPRKGWQLPGMSPRVSRLVTAAGALVILAGGGYAIAAGIGQPVSTSSSSAPSATERGLPGVHAGQSIGPRVNYGQSSSERSIQTVSSNENFVRGRLATQAADAVRKARLDGVHSGPAAHPGALPGSATSASADHSGTRTGLLHSQVEGCVDAVAAGRTVVLVEFARFDGRSATIIVAAAADGLPAYVWAVGTACSATNRDVLAQQSISHA